jgi:CheY-like chemotaxis protein
LSESGQDADPSPLRAFAAALMRELDRVGYAVPPARTNHLAADLDVGRMQAYRIATGASMPTLNALLRLRKLGVSLDAVLAAIDRDTPRGQEIVATVLGAPMRVQAVPDVNSDFALTMSSNGPTLRHLRPGQTLGPGEMAVGGLRFVRPLPRVALVEDDGSTLTVLAAELGRTFAVLDCRLGKELLDKASVEPVDAIVADWRLPDVDGPTLIAELRRLTPAPIVIITGERSEGPTISQMLLLPNIHYVAKPVDGHILRSLVESAIQQAAPAQP